MKNPIPLKAQYACFRGESVIEFVEREVPGPGAGQLVVQCRANALCASDMGAYAGGSLIAPGHETAGTVAAAGAGTSIAEGTAGVYVLVNEKVFFPMPPNWMRRSKR
jgi:threonine 3-dehydrogenase